ncbi:MAG: glycoside hydrolase family 5 protein [Lachnospiraceae bacterium]|nr:glycoside hydrolase family 5 protein [Lachnospiraceae bacterium]
MKRSALFCNIILSAMLLGACKGPSTPDVEPTPEPTAVVEATPTEAPAEPTPTESAPEPTEAEEEGPISVHFTGSATIPDTEAMNFTKDMCVGWNLGNSFDAIDCDWLSDELDYEDAWCQAKASYELISTLKEAGFKTIRIPVSWHNHVDANNKISGPWLDRVEEVVKMAYDEGFYVILNIHHDEEQFYPSYAKLDKSLKYVKDIWKQLAERFADYDEHLIFETMNEPRQVGMDYEWWINDTSADYAKESFDCINQLNQAAVDAIRGNGKGFNLSRYIMVPGYCASTYFTAIDDFVLPEDSGEENRLIISIHAYTPYEFALNTSGTTAFSIDKKQGTADIDDFVRKLYQKFTAKGIPVVLGEWGALDKDNYDARLEHAAYFVYVCAHYGIPTVYWDNNAYQTDGENFQLIDRSTLEWRFPELKDQIIFSANEEQK